MKKKDLETLSEKNNSSENQEENIHIIEESIENQLINLASTWPALSTTERKEKFSSLPRTEAEELFLSF